jgi:hypothetical protein
MYLWNRPFNGKPQEGDERCKTGVTGEMPEMHTPFSFHHLLYQFISFKPSKSFDKRS